MKIITDIELNSSRHVIPDQFVQILTNNTIIKTPSVYFTKIEPTEGEILRRKYGGNSDPSGSIDQLSNKTGNLSFEKTKKAKNIKVKIRATNGNTD